MCFNIKVNNYRVPCCSTLCTSFNPSFVVCPSIPEGTPGDEEEVDSPVEEEPCPQPDDVI